MKGEQSVQLELGAEFMHGHLPVTLQLIEEAGLKYSKMEGKTFQFKNGELKKDAEFIEDWSPFIRKLNQLDNDMSIRQFLDEYFAEEKYEEFRNSVKSFVEGYDAADTNYASAFALREEWSNEGEWANFRIINGHSSVMEFLANDFKEAGGIINLDTIVKEIIWKHRQVEVVTADGKTYESQQILITVPVSVLRANPNSKAGIAFNPEIPLKIEASRLIGFGSVIKILLQFREPFWNSREFENGKYKNFSFIFSDAPIPTWWSQHPQPSSLLTGWLAGPQAEKLKDVSEDKILKMAISSLSEIFKIEKDRITSYLIDSHLANWNSDPFTLGAYAYATVNTLQGRKVLNEPVDKTLYFGGEALYEGAEMGTVEAALASGKNVARRIIEDH